MKKNKLVLICISLFIFFLLVLLFSLLFFRRGSSFINDLEISYAENKTDQNMYSLYPMSDEYGKKTEPYIFKVVNNSVIKTKYNLIIEDVKEKNSSDSFLKREKINYELKRDNRIISSGNLGNINKNILATDSISSSTTNTYELRIWLTNDFEDTSWMGKYYNYNILVKQISK